MESNKPKMKIKINTNKLKLNTSAANSPAPTPAPSFSASTPLTAATPNSAPRKIKIVTKSTANTPAPTPASAEDIKPKKSKAGRTTKPSAKILESRKRKDDSDTEEEEETIHVQAPRISLTSGAPPPKKKLKLTIGSRNSPVTPSSKTPIAIKVKQKGKVVKRPPGVGYDSEASDREHDPHVEEACILRMLPGDDCDYLQEMIATRKIGLSRHQGGADVHMKFFDPLGRRGAITIRGNVYAATMVELPCIIEGMKSWDKRGFFKSGDICQMLWVFAPIEREEIAKTIELPKMINPKTSQYPHGLTAPMHDARKRRFRKRVAQHTIEAVEEAVEALLKADAAAASSSWDMMDQDAGSRRGTTASTDGEEEGYEYEDGEQDAEGEEDDTNYFNTNHHGNEHMDAELEADLEAEFEAEMEMEQSMAETPMDTNNATPTNPADTVQVKEEEDSGDESLMGEGYEEDDEVGEEEIDEDERARLAQIQSIREDIAEFERQIATMQAQIATQQNPILKKRLGDSIRKINEELELKKALLGEDDS